MCYQDDFPSDVIDITTHGKVGSYTCYWLFYNTVVTGSVLFNTDCRSWCRIQWNISSAVFGIAYDKHNKAFAIRLLCLSFNSLTSLGISVGRLPPYFWNYSNATRCYSISVVHFLGTRRKMWTTILLLINIIVTILIIIICNCQEFSLRDQ